MNGRVRLSDRVVSAPSAALQAHLFARAENRWSHGNMVLMGDAAAGNASLVRLTPTVPY